jgi:exosortase
MEKNNSYRNILFLLFNILFLVIYRAPIKALLTLSINNGYYSYIILIPLISLCLVFLDRKNIFFNTNYSFIPGAAIISLGVLLSIISSKIWIRFDNDKYLSLMIVAVLLFWIGGFLLFFGARSLQEARSAFLYLIFLVPVPSFAMDEIIEFLQQGSAEAANILFKLVGIPYLRDGVTFHFSELSIEITEQCSGIRSSMALLITAILGGHVFLRTYWRRTFLVLSALPIAVIKNGFRVLFTILVGSSFYYHLF